MTEQDKEVIIDHILAAKTAHENNLSGYYNKDTLKPVISLDKLYERYGIHQRQSEAFLDECELVESYKSVNQIKYYRVL